jgi:hypothetical protein
MKRLLIFTLLMTATAAFAAGQTKAERLVEEIKRMDRQWQVESYGSKDLKEYDRIVADDFSIVGSNGKTLTKAEKRTNIAADYTEPSARASGDVFQIDEASHSVRVFEKTAISTGFIIEKYVYKGTQVNSRVYFTCTYLKRRDAWQVVAAHYSRINQK